jgi:hypothetical protein
MKILDVKNKYIILCLVLLIAATTTRVMALNPQAASNNISAGLRELATNPTPAGLSRADALFASAFSNNPTSDQARVLKVCSGSLLIPNSTTFTQLLLSSGLTNSAPGTFSFYNFPLPSTDSYGTPILKGNNTSVISYMDANIRPQLSNAISMLGGVSTNVNFTVNLDVPTVVDYGDVQLLLCGAYLANAVTYLDDSYNLNILLSDLAKTLSGTTTFQDTLAGYPQLFTLSGNNQRALAKDAFINANSAFQKAIQFIASKRVTNQFTQHLIEIDTADPLTKATMLSTAQRFAALASSFTNSVIFPIDTNNPTPFDGQTISLYGWLNTPSSPRSWVGSGSLWGNLLNTNGILDPTFSGILPLMTSGALNPLLLANGMIHRVIAGGGIISLGRGFYRNQSSADGFNAVAGNYLSGSCFEDGISYGPTYGFLWDGGTNYTIVDYPQAQNTRIFGITTNGAIWGNYNKWGISGGYLYQNGKYTPVNYPGSPSTSIAQVSGNLIAGTFYLVSENSNGVFLYDGTNYKTASLPQYTQWSQVSGISGSNVFGLYTDWNGNQKSFLFNGRFTTAVSYPSAFSTQIAAVIGGKVIGSYWGYNGSGCFLYTNGVYSTLAYPGSVSTSINWNTPPNQVLGNYQDTQWNSRGFVYDGSKFTSIIYPGASWTSIEGGSQTTNWGTFWGNNTNGIFVYRNGIYSSVPVPDGSVSAVCGSNVVGTYWTNGTGHAYLYTGQKVITFDVPDAMPGTTYPTQISSNWIVGSYSDTNWNYCSFAYWIGAGSTPVVPGTAPSLGVFSIPNRSFGSPSFTLNPPPSTSPGTWSYSSGNTNVATVSGNTVTIRGVGTAVITATQAESGNFLAASARGNLVVNKAIPTLGVFVVPAKTYGAPPFALTAPTSSSTGAWSYSSGNTNVATVSGNTVTIRGAGTALLTATQAASRNYDSANTTAHLVVLKAPQTITFTLSATNIFTKGGLIPLNASSSSGLPITYTSGNTNILTISGNNAVMRSNGTNTITASQLGNSNYNAASNAVRTITLLRLF